MSKLVDQPRERLGDLLVKANLIDGVQLRVALTAQKDSGERLGTTLVELGFIEESVLAAFLSKQADMPCINITNIHIPEDVRVLVPKEIALKYEVVPIRRAGDVLYLAMADPFNAETVLAVEQVLPGPLSVTPMIAPEVSLKKCLQRYYEPEKQQISDETAQLLGIIDEVEAETIRALHVKVDRLSEDVVYLKGLVRELHKWLVDDGSSDVDSDLSSLLKRTSADDDLAALEDNPEDDEEDDSVELEV